MGYEPRGSCHPTNGKCRMNALLTIVEESRRDAVMAAINCLSPTLPLNEITLLQGGYSSSQTYKIIINNKPYVLRVMRLDHTLSDRQQQIKCLQEGADLGIAPYCHYATAEADIIIMDYIAPTPLRFTKDNVGDFAVIIQTLHQAPLFGPTHLRLFDYLQDLEKQLSVYSLSNILINYFSQINNIQNILDQHQELASCHNDINANNILFNGQKMYLIDWEAAGAGDPYFDLATVCQQLLADDVLEKHFLRQYFETQPTAYQMAKLYLMKQISCYFYALHFLLFAAQADIPLSDDALIATAPTLLEWRTNYALGKYGLTTPYDFLLFAMTQVKLSLTQMNNLTFEQAKIILK